MRYLLLVPVVAVVLIFSACGKDKACAAMSSAPSISQQAAAGAAASGAAREEMNQAKDRKKKGC